MTKIFSCLFFVAQCFDGCDDCPSSTTNYIDADTIDLDVTCDTCANIKVIVATELCYGKHLQTLAYTNAVSLL